MSENNIENLFEPIWQTVYRKILDNIIGLRLSPGASLSETHIASDMDVSRSPVRTALEKLCDDGMVEKQADGTYNVLPITPEECRALCVVRGCLEGEAAKLAAKFISTEDLERLKELIINMKKKVDIHDYVKMPEYDQEFHQIIVNASGNKYLIHLYSQLQTVLMRYRYFQFSLDAVNSVGNLYYNHVAIYQALKNHLGEVAKSEVLSDVSSMNVVAGYFLKYY